MKFSNHFLKCKAAPIAVGLFTFFTLSIGQAAVWKHDREWTEHDENAYAEWVKTKFNPEIFWRTGAYPDISTDCADAVYGMRMIYAFENKLPFVIRSGGGFLSNETSRYDAIQDPRARFRAFMKNVMDITNTTTLSDDTYPIEISREAITPGTMYLATGTHVYAVVDVTDGGITIIQSSTVPREVRVMTRVEAFPNYIPGDLKIRNKKNVDGFRRFKQPQMYSKIPTALPHYSLEQFEKVNELRENGLKFYDWVQSRLATRVETIDERLSRSLLLVCYSSWDRGEAINRGYFAARIKQIKQTREQKSPCFTAAEYDEYSTPTRDRRLTEYFHQLHDLVSIPGYERHNSETKQMLEHIIAHNRTPEMEERVIQWCDVNRQTGGGPQRPMSLAELHDLALNKKLVSDPHATIAQRWGLEPFVSSCPQY